LAKLLKGALILVLAGILTLLTLLISLWTGHYVGVTLPAPSGPFAVGRVLETWSDEQRADPMFPHRRTELVVWTWYPCAPSAGQKRAEYRPEYWRRQMPEGVMGTLLWRDVSLVRSHSVIGGSLSPKQPRYLWASPHSGITMSTSVRIATT